MTEIAHLLTPISDNDPSGSYLKLDRTAYRSLRNVYNSAQSSFLTATVCSDAEGIESLCSRVSVDLWMTWKLSSKGQGANFSPTRK